MNVTNRQIIEQEIRVESYRKKKALSDGQTWDMLNYILNGLRKRAGKPLVNPLKNPYRLF